MFTKRIKGITLISLVITIVVLLILAGVAISVATNGNGIFNKAKEAVGKWNASVANEQIEINKIYEEYITKPEVPTEQYVEVTLENGSKVKLTKDNFGEYLGKKVTNYKTIGGIESVTVGSSNYTVSTTYRLYYIDFDNKFGDGAGTVYLKADTANSIYGLGQDESASTLPNVKIKNLNPELYKPGVTPPTNTNMNMKAVTWLTNTNNWQGLVTSGASTEIGNKVKYVVGAPSLKMMADSYNTHYNLTNATPDNSARTASSPRTRLFYKYRLGSKDYGYVVAPTTSTSSVDGYGSISSYHTVQSDSKINSMYYGGGFMDYWLGSPGASSDSVMFFSGGNGGYLSNGSVRYTLKCGLCPLVSLQSDVQLKLSD